MTDIDQTDAWLVAAGREMDNLSADAGRLAATITSKLGNIRRPGRLLDTDDPAVTISDRALKQVLAARIRHELGRLVVFISADGNGAQLDRIEVGLVARYRDILSEDSDRVRDIVNRVVTTALGADHAMPASRRIDVRWQDVETHQWRD